MASSPPLLQNRLTSLDQFRGYTVAGMFLVNFLGGFWACPQILKHHNIYCSYADTIMPQFFFAVGFSFRLSFGRRAITQGLSGAYGHVVKRLLGLALVAIVITYQGKMPWHSRPVTWESMKAIGFWHAIWPENLKREWFQTLMHIAVTSLWILPVIRLRASWRILYMIATAVLHLALSHWFYFFWVNGAPPSPENPSGIDGGMLGFLTWTIPTIMGTVACDIVMAPSGTGGKLTQLLGWGILLMALGWIASCGTRWYDVPTETLEKAPEFAAHPVIPAKTDVDRWATHLKSKDWERALVEPPFVPPPGNSKTRVSDYWLGEVKKPTEDHSADYRKKNYWMMSQRSGTISYLTFGAGLSLVVYALFFVLSDQVGLRIGVFRTLGSNALFGYVLHDITGEAVKNFVSKDVPTLVMWISFAVFFFLTWLFIRSLEKRNIYIKL